MKKDLASARPWKIHQPSYNETPLIFADGDEWSIADITGKDQTEKEANAELIVRAVNNHDALLEALKDVLEYVSNQGFGFKDEKLYKKALNAIANAEK